MKPIYIYATRIRSFWVLLPMSIVLTLALRFNNAVEHWSKLYPLIIFSIGAIVFTFIYLLRFISISYSEIKYIGRFTTRDSATVNAGKTLVIELLEKRRIGIKLYGNEGYNPEIKWLTHADGEDGDVCLFRGRAYGTQGVAIRILSHFGVVDMPDIEAILGDENFSKSYQNVTVSTETVDSHKHIKIRFDRTI